MGLLHSPCITAEPNFASLPGFHLMTTLDSVNASNSLFNSQIRNAPSASSHFSSSQGVDNLGVSILSDAAEELCLYVAERIEHKSLDEREIDAESSLNLMKTEDASAYLMHAKAFKEPKQLIDLIRLLWSGQETPKELALRTGCSRAEEYALLQYAVQEGMAHGAHRSILDGLREDLLELELHHGPEIRSSLNTIHATSEFGETREKVLTFQKTYRDVVLGQPSLAKTLNILLERLAGLDGVEFLRGLHGMIKAAGQDLAALRPSCDMKRLQLLIQDLYHLEVATTFVEGCQTASADMARIHGCTAIRPVPLMQDLVAITDEKWVAANRFINLAKKFDAMTPTAQLAFLSATHNLMRTLPVKVYPDTDARWKILGASQEALDAAIDIEDAERS